jgi:hypothetical protein
MWRVVPETKGRSLEQMETMWRPADKTSASSLAK